ncbi:hypothetical protein Ddye_011086 [Dipteronia dyeriana]|uniref:Uncharacterized protein n=1 Tax=Dipteronia dyeriana TaxID=168575 RepID=A0AAD9XEL8_9ROSI|nr:hypothetical protein Ddye_011086 [Dipteronia dyeriana]
MGRNTLKIEIFNLFNMERDKTFKLLESIESKVALTMDVWTSRTQVGYMVVTIHFNDKLWVLLSRIMRFIHVLSPHDATSLGDQLMTCLRDWNMIASSKRIEAFECVANQLKINYSKKLVLECLTRWNSTYFMLSIALMYKDVLVCTEQREPQYRYLPYESDW